MLSVDYFTMINMIWSGINRNNYLLKKLHICVGQQYQRIHKTHRYDVYYKSESSLRRRVWSLGYRSTMSSKSNCVS